MKKEDIEQAAHVYALENDDHGTRYGLIADAFRDGAQLAAEQMFTKEDLRDFLIFYKFEFWKVYHEMSVQDAESLMNTEKKTGIEASVVEVWIKERNKNEQGPKE